MKVIISEYKEIWTSLFEKEKYILLQALCEDRCLIEHIGSTSVKGLAAKPIIDVMIGLRDFSKANNLVTNIEALGYTYIPKYEDVMPYRRFFKKVNNGNTTHQIHMVAIGSEFWERHLLFRNYLRQNPDTANEYEVLKRNLAEREWNDINEYADAKTEFIRSIEKKAAAIQHKT